MEKIEKQTYYLEFGDLSGDGHEKTRTAYYTVHNTNEHEVREIWEKSVENLGFDYLLQFDDYDVEVYKNGVWNKVVDYLNEDKTEEEKPKYGYNASFYSMVIDIFNRTAEIMNREARFSGGDKKDRYKIDFLDAIGKDKDLRYSGIGYGLLK
jgi:hypothetical protein